MSEKITHRTVTTHRWICTNKELCEEIDGRMAELMKIYGNLSALVEHRQISGLQCLTLDAQLSYSIRALKNERKTLWRRVKVVTEDVIEGVEDNADTSMRGPQLGG